MKRQSGIVSVLCVLAVCGLTLGGRPIVMAQQSTGQSPTPEGYVPRGTRPGKGLAPGLKVTDLVAINKGLFGWTDVERGIGQKKIELNEEAEIVALMGSISVNAQGQSNVHAHGTVALSDGSVKGGHWWEARVSIIAEVFVTEEEGGSDQTK